MSIVPMWVRLLLLGGVILLVIGSLKGCHDSLIKQGRAIENAVWTKRSLDEAQAKAREGLRRLEKQQENQRAQDSENARLQAAAARNAADADSVRQQSAANARSWAQRLADSPTVEDVQAAGAAIGVLTELLGRADRRAGILASYADTARASGLKCEADYDALGAPR